MKPYYLLLITFLFTSKAIAQKVTTKPAFHVNFSGSSHISTPTADKPQSKLWYMDSSWWALLPDSSGPTLWQRTNNGWKEHKEVSNRLKGIPSRADVWYENRTATAVSVSDSSLSTSSLCIFRIKSRDSSDVHLQAKVLAWLNIPQKKDRDIETATIAKDADGEWWVAADVGGKSIYVWASKDAVHWSSALLVGKHINPDDISCITAMKHSVIIIWSNQNDQAVYSREHINGPIDSWSVIHTIETGGKTADDHINTALSADGTLWAATKNSADKVNHPQLVLRVREPEENWKNYPYLLRKPGKVPSRPIVITTSDPDLVLAGYTVYDYKNLKKSRIVFGMIDTTSAKVLTNKQTVIKPDMSIVKVRINDITGPKRAFPSDGPWIILASDSKGNIYEANLRRFFGK
jgi:hypothetical protein